MAVGYGSAAQLVAAICIASAPLAPAYAQQIGRASSTENSASSESVNTNSLTEIIVTAEKRDERLQDVPIPMSVLTANTLLETGQLRVKDYFATVPGLSVGFDGYYGDRPSVALRGITTGMGNPTVNFTLDDIPIGGSTTNQYGGYIPDIDPGDLQQIEVLRGPQGTLYGASSLGGLIKYVTIDPSTTEVSGRVQLGASDVYNGVRAGYDTRGAVNIPVSDTIAVRISAFTRTDPGYIENMETGQNGVNTLDSWGGRVAALWKPSDEFSVKLGALLQDTKLGGFPWETIGLAPYQQEYPAGVGTFEHNFQLYTAVIKGKLGSVDLTSATGYTKDHEGSILPLGSPYFNQFSQQYFGVDGTVLSNPQSQNYVEKVSQEFRAAASLGQRFDWLVGVFFDHENSPATQSIEAVDSLTGVQAGSLLSFNFPTTYTEYAGFADITYHFTDRFDVQLGARESHNKQTYVEVDTGPITEIVDGFPPPYHYPAVDSSDSSFTYLFTPRYRISPDLMTYIRIASGYRPGGPNSSPAVALGGAPAFVKPDKTVNYEVGLKGETANHLFTYDASVYYITWKDIQLELFAPPLGYGYLANGSQARSDGVELSADLRPLEGLTISAWFVYNDAVLTQDLPPTATVFGLAGDRLPMSSRYSSSVSAEQKYPLSGGYTALAALTASYVGERVGTFLPTDSEERQSLPQYTTLQLRSGLEKDQWTLNLYANNVTNKRGILNGGVGFSFPAFIYIQPRTVGVTVMDRF